MSDVPRHHDDGERTEAPNDAVTAFDERLDTALRRACAPPEDAAFRAIAARAVRDARDGAASGTSLNGSAGTDTGSREPVETTRDSATPLRAFPLRRVLLLAASLALTISGVLLAWSVLGPRTGVVDPYAPQAHRTMAEVYADRIDRAWTPDWVCRDDEEFASTFRRQLGQRLVLRGLPETVAAAGIGYSNTITPDTIFVLVTAGADRIIVFADRADAEQGRAGQWELDLPEDLQLFRRTEGDIVLYELSPRTAPTVLPHLVDPSSEPDDAP